MIETLEIIFDLIMATIEIVILMYFCRGFSFKCEKHKLAYGLICLSLFVGVFLIANFSPNLYIKYILMGIYLLLVLRCFFQERLEIIFFYVAIYSLSAYSSMLVVESLFKTTNLEFPVSEYYYTEFCYTLFGRLLEFIILYFFEKILKRIHSHKEHPYGMRLIYMQIIISVTYFIMIGTSLYGKKQISLEYAKLIFFFSAFAMCSVLFSVIYTEHYMNIMQKSHENETALLIKEKQCELYKHQIEEQQDIRSLYHDMKNHILILENCHAEDYKSYLLELEARLEKHHIRYPTGNPYLDILLQEKVKLCDQGHIRMEIQVNFSDIYVLEPTEICIVCGNLLDNALEANLRIMDKDKRFIEMAAHKQKTNFIIKMSNPCNKNEMVSNAMSFFTTKNDWKNHGYGIKNIKHIVFQKGGFFTTEIKKGIFTAYIVLPLKQ